ncbi:hypothetical protein Tco_0627728 [Tanacetum coccineum]|uniref:Uncharacterized protein n=1 Tax=Tanacetum coccineum TaxID=301880 RepID=A0ABQ4WNA1_9ASTR
MFKVADLSSKPIQSLIPPSREVNADDTPDKSLSRTFVPPVTQPKAPTAKTPRKKKIPSLTQPEVLKSSRISKYFSTQATHLQPAEEFVVIADATKSVDASESEEVQGNQPESANSEKITVLDQNIMEEEDAGVQALDEPTLKQLMDKIDQTDDANITFIGSGIDMELDDSSSNLHSMPSDDLVSLTSFETPDLNDEESNSVTKEHSADNLNATSDGVASLPNASTALKETMLGLLAKALKVSLLSLIQESIQNAVQQSIREQTSLFHFQVHQTLEEQLDTMMYKPMNKQLHAFNKLESRRFVQLQTKLSKVIQSKIGIKVKARELIPYIEEGGSDLKMPNVKSFVTPEGVLSQEDFIAKLKEMKRLADLKA